MAPPAPLLKASWGECPVCGKRWSVLELRGWRHENICPGAEHTRPPPAPSLPAQVHAPGSQGRARTHGQGTGSTELQGLPGPCLHLQSAGPQGMGSGVRLPTFRAQSSPSWSCDSGQASEAPDPQSPRPQKRGPDHRRPAWVTTRLK